MTGAIGPRLAIWGTFDVANFGDHLFPRIFEHEMRRRLPTARVQAFSPLGHLHPVPFDGGLVVEPLGEWSPERLAELAKSHDLIAIGGGELIHMRDDAYSTCYGIGVEEARRLRPSAFFIDGLGPALEEGCPVAWHSVGIPFEFNKNAAGLVRSALEKRAYVSVCDDISRDRLLRAGVTREIAVVPDSAFLVDRVVADEQIERRLGYLRGIESYPSSERPLVVQGSRALLPCVEDIAGALANAMAEAGDVPIVLLETGPGLGDEDFAKAIAPYLRGRVYRMPASPLVEDIVAAISHSRGFVGVSLRGNVITFARGLPSAVLDLGTDYSKLAGFVALARCEDALVRSPVELLPAIRRVLSGTRPWDGLSEIASRIDSHFDALAEIAERSASQGLESSSAARRSNTTEAPGESRERETALRRAFDARGHRLVEQRLRLGNEIENLERELAELRQQHENEIECLGQKLEASERRIAELDSYRAELDSYRAELETEIHNLRTSRTFRYTAPLRTFVGWLRRIVK
ncbi:MAG: polysaccharide pyruvyl transferase family protein [Gaiellaceae bacterium]